MLGYLRLFIVAYPFALYFGSQFFDFHYISLILIALFAIRLLLMGNSKIAAFRQLGLVSASIGILLALLNLFFKHDHWLKLYPILVHLALFTLFASTLKQPQTMVERFARLQEPNLDEQGVLYTRQVTKVWCVFFFTQCLYFTLYHHTFNGSMDLL